MNSKKNKRIFSFVLFIAIAGAIFYFMFGAILGNWSVIAAYPWKINWLSIFSSLGLSVAASLLAMKAAHLLCSMLGGKISFLRFLYIFCLSQLGRYLPGRFWHVVGFTVLLQQERVKKSVSIMLPFLYQGTMIIIFFLLGTVFCGPSVITRLIPELSWLVYFSTVVLLMVLIFFPFFLKFLNYVINLKYKEIKIFYLYRKDYYTALGILILSGIVLAASFFVFVSSLVTVSIKDAPFIGGSFLLSYVTGWIVFVTPGGLGVREGTLAILLSTWLSPALSNVVALAARLWITLAEIVLFGGVWIWARLLRGEKFPFFNPNGLEKES